MSTFKSPFTLNHNNCNSDNIDMMAGQHQHQHHHHHYNYEQLRILLPLLEDIDIVQFETEISQLTVDRESKIELLSAGLGSGAARKVVAISSGSASECERLQVQIDNLSRKCRTVLVQQGESNECSNNAGDSFDPSTNMRLATGLSDDIQVRIIQQNANFLEVSVPLASVGCIDGWAGRQRLQNYLLHGTLIDVIGRIQENEEKNNTCRVLISGIEKDSMEACRASLLSALSKASLPISMQIPLEMSTIRFLLNHRREEIHGILQEYASSMQIFPHHIQLYGLREDATKLAMRRILQLSFECHTITLLIPHRDQPVPLEELVKAVQKGRVDLLYRTTLANPFLVAASEIQIVGTATGIERALAYLPSSPSSSLRIEQTKYQQRQTEDIKEFISGKKDGKLIKIMKETGVSISLLPDQLEGLIEICLVGTEPRQVLRALLLLTGEFPSETSFFIGEAHHKRLIGHGGKTIQRVMKKYAVYIKFQSTLEAQEVVGMDVNGILPKSLINRLPNVIVRTPAKNGEALNQARVEILEMAEEGDSGKPEHLLYLRRSQLLKMTREERANLEVFFKSFADSIDVQAINRAEDVYRGQFRLKVCGFSAAMNRFIETIDGKDLEIAKIFDKLLVNKPSPGSNLISPPNSPTLSHRSWRHSTSGGSPVNAWASGGGNSAILRYLDSIEYYSETATSSSTASPMLSPISPLSQATLSPLALHSSQKSLVHETLNPEGKIFSPVVGNSIQKGPWNYGLPRLPLVDAMILGDHDGKNLKEGRMKDFLTLDWKAITAAHYRRRASLLFSYS